MARVHGIHEIELKPRVTGEEVERFFTQEVVPATRPGGVRLHLWKGDRGERAEQYALVIEIESVETRDRHFPTDNTMGEEAQRAYSGSPSRFERWASLASAPGPETVYTDYVTIGE